MGKPQIAIRIPPLLLVQLENYVRKTGTSKTDVVVSAIANYLGSSEMIPLNQKIADLERRVTHLEFEQQAMCCSLQT